jgi:putative FmdB family regulatory protein
VPIYEFDCQACGEPFEELVLSARGLDDVTCPDCGSTQVKKKLSTFSARVSGGGRSAESTASANCAPGGL